MTDEQAIQAVISEWLIKSDQALAAARREYAAGDLSLAINRVYYASFYALTAALLRDGFEFSSHAAVRSALHQFFVKPGRLSSKLGAFYDQAFEDRQHADYTALAEFQASTVSMRIEQAATFVDALRKLASQSQPEG